jgi:hypothetical protein
MNLSWKLAKILFASLLIIFVIFGAINLILPKTFSGENLSFAIGHGTVTMTNPSSEPIAVQILGTGTGRVRLTSPTQGIADTSEIQGSGRTASQLIEFMLPAGQTDFITDGGNNVSFSASTPTVLSATVQMLSQIEIQGVIFISGLIVLGALFYISRSTNHRWLSMIRGQAAPVPVVATTAKTSESAQGSAPRAYGDNRK